MCQSTSWSEPVAWQPTETPERYRSWPGNTFFFLLSLVHYVLSLIKYWVTTWKPQPTVSAKSSHPISESLSLLQMWLRTVLSDVSYQDGLNRCLKNFLQPIYSLRHLLVGAAVPVSSETLCTWAEQLQFSLTAFTNPGHGGHRRVELRWSNELDKMCEINALNS